MIEVNNVEFGRLIAAAAGTPFNPETDICIARVEDGQLWGGVTYTGYTGASIQMHMAGVVPNWADRRFIWAAFHYPFVQLECRKVFGQVPETNAKALEIDKRLGFKEVARIEDVFPDGACIILALAREDCRWLKHKPSGIEFIPHSEA